MIGDYKLEIKEISGSQTLAEKNFNLKWTDMPVTINDMDLAISQTLYIATSDEFKRLKAAKTREEKEKRFMEFWRSKDPSPNSGQNELMQEYYARIATANERYSHHFPGWKTDMGMIYIIFGDPSSIDRHPFVSNSKPYEIWEYYDINRRFVFVDNSGFGDYKLTTPIWDDSDRAY